VAHFFNGLLVIVWHDDEARRLEIRTLQLLRTNVDPTSFPTVAETLRIGQRLLETSDVRGGIVFNPLGEQVGDFGRTPSLSFSTIRRDNIRSLLSADRLYLDVFYPSEVTGLANPIVLRLDTAGINTAVFARVREQGLVIILAALITSGMAMVILSFAIVRPLIQLRDAAMSATDDPGHADRFRLGWSRSDEIGEASRAFDLLLTAVSVVHQEDLAASQEVIERSTYAMLTYDPAGRLTTANPAALDLFQVRSVEELGRLPPNFIRHETAEGVVNASAIELLMHGDINHMVTIDTPAGEHHCHMTATTIRKKSGMVLRHMVTFLNLTSQVCLIQELEEECARLRSSASLDRRRIAEMRGLFEACLILLPRVPKTDYGAEVTPVPESVPNVSTERIVNTWYADASRNGLVDGQLQHDVLSDVRGDASKIEVVFRQALMAVHAGSRRLRPTLAVDASVTDKDVTFVVREVREGSNDLLSEASVDTRSNIAIFRLGLAHALFEAGGRLVPLGDDLNAVSFALPAASKARGTSNASRRSFRE
jgi:PAS domain-containing protein